MQNEYSSLVCWKNTDLNNILCFTQTKNKTGTLNSQIVNQWPKISLLNNNDLNQFFFCVLNIPLALLYLQIKIGKRKNKKHMHSTFFFCSRKFLLIVDFLSDSLHKNVNQYDRRTVVEQYQLSRLPPAQETMEAVLSSLFSSVSMTDFLLPREFL